MVRIKRIRRIFSSINATACKWNQTIHGGSSEDARRTTEHIRSAATGISTGKGAYDCVVAYQCNDYVCLTVSGIGTVADVVTHVCGYVPSLKRFTPLTGCISVGCKSFVYICRTGKIPFVCKKMV